MYEIQMIITLIMKIYENQIENNEIYKNLRNPYENHKNYYNRNRIKKS